LERLRLWHSQPKLQPGDPLEVSFPEQSAGTGKGPFEVRKPWGHSKGTAEIVCTFPVENGVRFVVSPTPIMTCRHVAETQEH
jgi:hypothetical protein